MALLVRQLCKNAIIPKRATNGSAGYDLASVCKYVIQPGNKETISTGLSIRVPEGTYGRLAPRSGLAVKHCIDVLAGVVDRDYKEEVKVILINHSKEPFNIEIGDRVAQLVVECIKTPDVEIVDMFPPLDSTRVGGFGSTGTK